MTYLTVQSSMTGVITVKKGVTNVRYEKGVNPRRASIPGTQAHDKWYYTSSSISIPAFPVIIPQVFFGTKSLGSSVPQPCSYPLHSTLVLQTPFLPTQLPGWQTRQSTISHTVARVNADVASSMPATEPVRFFFFGLRN